MCFLSQLFINAPLQYACIFAVVMVMPSINALCMYAVFLKEGCLRESSYHRRHMNKGVSGITMYLYWRACSKNEATAAGLSWNTFILIWPYSSSGPPTACKQSNTYTSSLTSFINTVRPDIHTHTHIHAHTAFLFLSLPLSTTASCTLRERKCPRQQYQPFPLPCPFQPSQVILLHPSFPLHHPHRLVVLVTTIIINIIKSLTIDHHSKLVPLMQQLLLLQLLPQQCNINTSIIIHISSNQ